MMTRRLCPTPRPRLRDPRRPRPSGRRSRWLRPPPTTAFRLSCGSCSTNIHRRSSKLCPSHSRSKGGLRCRQTCARWKTLSETCCTRLGATPFRLGVPAAKLPGARAEGVVLNASSVAILRDPRHRARTRAVAPQRTRWPLRLPGGARWITCPPTSCPAPPSAASRGRRSSGSTARVVRPFPPACTLPGPSPLLRRWACRRPMAECPDPPPTDACRQASIPLALATGCRCPPCLIPCWAVAG